MGDIGHLKPQEIEALAKTMAASGYCSGPDTLASARALLTAVIIPIFQRPIPPESNALLDASATNPSRASTCRACHREGVREGTRGVPEGWYRINVGDSEHERSAGPACSPECLRMVVDQVLAEPTERPDPQPRIIFCGACRKESAPALSPPEGWLSVRRHTGAGRFHPAGIFCAPGCLARRLEPSVKAKGATKQPAAVKPIVPPAPGPIPKTRRPDLRTCAVCFEKVYAGAEKCPRGHRIGGMVKR